MGLQEGQAQPITQERRLRQVITKHWWPQINVRGGCLIYPLYFVKLWPHLIPEAGPVQWMRGMESLHSSWPHFQRERKQWKKVGICPKKFKSCCVAKGYSPEQDVDDDETFSHTVKLTSIWLIMQKKTVQENLILHQMDVKAAYEHVPIHFYMTQAKPCDWERGNVGVLIGKMSEWIKESGKSVTECCTTLSVVIFWPRILLITRDQKGIICDDQVFAASDDDL